MGELLEGMGSVITSIVAFVVILNLAKKNKQSAGNNKPKATKLNNPAPSTPRTTGVAEHMKGGTSGSADISESSSIRSVSRTMEDRNNDWLAKQLAYEKASQKNMSEMFGLKLEHAANCDADINRKLHSSSCDADGVDTAKA